MRALPKCLITPWVKKMLKYEKKCDRKANGLETGNPLKHPRLETSYNISSVWSIIGYNKFVQNTVQNVFYFFRLPLCYSGTVHEIAPLIISIISK